MMNEDCPLISLSAGKFKRRKITAFKAFLLRINSLTSDSELHAAAAYQLHSDKNLVNHSTRKHNLENFVNINQNNPHYETV